VNALPAHGRPVEQVLAELHERRAGDLPVDRATSYHFESGRPELHDLVAAAGAAMIGTNGLDPTAFPSIPSIENDLVVATALVHGGDTHTAGTVTSGGTESCLLAVLAAREQYRARRGDRHATPTVLVPSTAHPAFRKGAHLFDVEVVDVPVDPTTFRPDPADVAGRIDERTALVVVSAPEYAHGTLDPVAEVAAVAEDRSVACHLDACIGGWVLPFVREAEGLPPVDLSLPGVTSMSVDLHKYGYAPKGVSVLLYSDPARRRYAWFADAGWPGYPLVNTTLLSSRSLASAAAGWAVLQHLGLDGMRALALSAREATLRLAEKIRGIDGLRVVAPPATSLLAVTDSGDPDGPDVRVVVDEMAARGWPLQAQPARLGAPSTFHVTMTAGVAAHLDELVAALHDAVEAARGLGRVDPDARLVAVAASLDPATLDDATVDGLLALAGLGDGQAGDRSGPLLPERMAGVNALLEAVPPALVERLLMAVMSRVYGG
jgi:glutamate/tyrosine decarboxylase-like PLP-dependent enzyme